MNCKNLLHPAGPKGRTVGKPGGRLETVSFTLCCSLADRQKIDLRASQVGLVRSYYMLALARNDYLKPGPLSLLPDPAASPQPPLPGAGRPRSHPDKGDFTVSCEFADLKRVDTRCAQLGLRRTVYLIALARNDFLSPSPLVLLPDHTPGAVPGVSEMPDGTLKIDSGPLLSFFAMSDTPEHRAVLARMAKQLMNIKRQGN